MSNSTVNAARQRINSLLDEKSFMEIGGMISARSTDFNLSQTDTPSDGVITGYGLVNGKLVYVYSQDPAVLGGTIGEMHAKKISALYDMAMKMGAPVIGLIDCAGIRLQESFDALAGLGEIYSKQVMASGMIPQICAVFGNCGGGLSVVPALSDFTYVEKSGRVFVNSPDAVTGNRKEKCDTAAADYQSSHSGFVDEVGTEDEILSEIRLLIDLIPSNQMEGGCVTECQDDLNRACPELSVQMKDPRLMLRQISDEYLFLETRKEYGQELVTGFIKLNGITVGVAANAMAMYDQDGTACVKEFPAELTYEACDKAAQLVEFCDAFDIPVLSLVNTEGYSAELIQENRLAKAMAKLVQAFAAATVPKVSLITGTAYGSAGVLMNSKALGADLVYAWNTAKIGMMDAKLAAGIMYEKEGPEVIAREAAAYDELQSSVNTAARRGYVDRIIAPESTRQYLVAAFEMLFTKRVDGPMKKHGAK